MRTFSRLMVIALTLNIGLLFAEDQVWEDQIEVLSWHPRVFLIRNFLTAEECQHIIALAEDKLAPSTVIDERANRQVIHEARKSASMFFPRAPFDPIINAIEDRIALLTMIPLENGEGLQVLRYDIGGEYKPHYDYFFSEPQLKRGGQRFASFLMYLNTPEEGGQTIFPMIDLKVEPKQGTALLFFDCDLCGNVDPLTLHGGTPVAKGKKYLATKWLRQSEFH